MTPLDEQTKNSFPQVFSPIERVLRHRAFWLLAYPVGIYLVCAVLVSQGEAFRDWEEAFALFWAGGLLFPWCIFIGVGLGEAFQNYVAPAVLGYLLYLIWVILLPKTPKMNLWIISAIWLMAAASGIKGCVEFADY